MSSINTANVTDMSGMFKGCQLLTSIYCNDNWSSVNPPRDARKGSKALNFWVKGQQGSIVYPAAPSSFR